MNKSQITKDWENKRKWAVIAPRILQSISVCLHQQKHIRICKSKIFLSLSIFLNAFAEHTTGKAKSWIHFLMLLSMVRYESLESEPFRHLERLTFENWILGYSNFNVLLLESIFRKRLLNLKNCLRQIFELRRNCEIFCH